MPDAPNVSGARPLSLPLASGERAPPSPARGEGYEEALVAALAKAEPAAVQAIADERFEDAMSALASLRLPIDAFFEHVTVNAHEGPGFGVALLAMVGAGVFSSVPEACDNTIRLADQTAVQGSIRGDHLRLAAREEHDVSVGAGPLLGTGRTLRS